MGFGVWGSESGVWGLGFEVWGLGFGVRDWGLGFGAKGLGFRGWDSGFRVSDLLCGRVPRKAQALSHPAWTARLCRACPYRERISVQNFLAMKLSARMLHYY